MDEQNAVVEFEATYRRHVDRVLAGDLPAVMADMDPAALAHVFDGVEVPRGQVSAAEVVRAQVVDGLGVGEAVYTTPSGVIGLRSHWRQVRSTWLADGLENFEATPTL